MIFPFPFFTAPEMLRFASDAAFLAADAFNRLGEGFKVGARLAGGWEEADE